MPVNIDNFIRSLREVQRRRHAAIVAAVPEFCAALLVHANERCPVATHAVDGNPPGTLRASGEVTPVIDSGTRIQCTIQYTAAYAAQVHEDLQVQHAQGQAKWLELTMREDAPQLSSFVTRSLEAA